MALIAAGADFQAPGAEDYTALTYAACNGQEACVRILLEQGAQVMAVEGRALPLYSACQPACLPGVQSRAQETEPFALATLQVNQTNRLGNSALHGAVVHWRPNTVRLLLEAGASTAVRNNVGDLPIH